MANEDKKDFNAMLHDNKDMPKFQTIAGQKSIEKYGGMEAQKEKLEFDLDETNPSRNGQELYSTPQ